MRFPTKIDYLIYQHVFDKKEGYIQWLRENENDLYNSVGSYTIKIDDAWKIVEKMRLAIRPTTDNKWLVSKGDNWTEHESVTLAICLAALKEFGIEVNEEADKIYKAIEETQRSHIEKLREMGINV